MAGINQSTNNTEITGISNNFDVNKKHELNLDTDYRKSFIGRIHQLWVDFTDAINSPTTITMRLCKDENGNCMLATDTISVCAFGLTVTDSGSVAWTINIRLILDTEKVYLFCKTDTGSLSIKEVRLSFES